MGHIGLTKGLEHQAKKLGLYSVVKGSHEILSRWVVIIRFVLHKGHSSVCLVDGMEEVKLDVQR